MGFIKRILVGFFTLLGVVIGSITGALGLGKSEYFMELGDAVSDSAAPAQVEAANSASKAADSKAASKAATSKATASKAAPSTPGETQSASAPSGLSTPGSATPKSTPNTISAASGEAQSIQTPAQPRASEPAASAVMVPSKAAEEATSSPEPVEPFAPNHLLNRSTTGGRRRPGPSLNTFKDMARDVGRS